MGLRLLYSRTAGLLWLAAALGLPLVFAVSGCATSGDGNAFDTSGGSGASNRGNDASASGPAASSGDDQGAGSSGDVAASGDDVTVAGDDATVVADDAAGDDSSGDDGAVSACATNCAAPTPTYVCTTTLPAPSPVCDSKHKYCLCTSNAECNSNGLNVVNNGGCNSKHCSGSGTCTGGQFVDSAGCSVVAPTCNLGGNQGCPAKTTCEVNHGDCGGSAQCCWCTSDSACPVGGKCVNDATQKQCDGQGPCSGSGTDYDGMHCQLASPGIPLCAAQ
ncbi:MAG TPA: hypothetical protein VK762_15830 [Polyangiaceae bacterium]|nr:hypothetical protein [Polyangiaceae bacterium]